MNTLILFFILLIQLMFNQLIGNEYSEFTEPIFYEIEACSTQNWKDNIILEPTTRKPARTAILIIAPPQIGNNTTESRWRLGKQVWESYMNSQPNVDCYFVQCTYPKKNSLEQVWIEGNTIYVGDTWYENYQRDRILYKTIKALEFLEGKYSHFIRTNLNTFINLKAVNEYMETHHQSMYTAPLWQNEWYTIGYGIIFTADVARHIVDEYILLEQGNIEFIDCNHADDCALTALATGVWPFNKPHPFVCFSKLPCGVRQLMCKESLDTTRLSQYGVLLFPIKSLEEAIGYIDRASKDVILYRMRDGLSLQELTIFYEYLLHKIYPEIQKK